MSLENCSPQVRKGQAEKKGNKEKYRDEHREVTMSLKEERRQLLSL